jgi:hypothetical protein
MLRSARSGVLVVISCLAVILLGAQSAWAAQGWGPLSTAGAGAAGYGTGSGELTFNGERGLSIAGRATDVCGSDPSGNGMGVYVQVYQWYADGTSAGVGTHIKDANGCGNGASSYGYAAVTNPTGKRIAYVAVLVCEIDQDGSQQPICAASAKKYNPNV